jgi:hypothetical protein
MRDGLSIRLLLWSGVVSFPRWARTFWHGSMPARPSGSVEPTEGLLSSGSLRPSPKGVLFSATAGRWRGDFFSFLIPPPLDLLAERPYNTIPAA